MATTLSKNRDIGRVGNCTIKTLLFATFHPSAPLLHKRTNPQRICSPPHTFTTITYAREFKSDTKSGEVIRLVHTDQNSIAWSSYVVWTKTIIW